MEATVETFRERLGAPWLAGESRARTQDALDAALDALHGKDGPIVVALQEPRAYLLHALAALALGRTCVLASPSWTEPMVQGLYYDVDTVLGEVKWPPAGEGRAGVPDGSLLIATGGSGGRLRLAVHSWEGLCAAVNGYTQYWQTNRVDVLNLLPLHHVGGFVPAMRSFISGGRLTLADWKAVEGGAFPLLDSGWAHLSLVATQLRRLLSVDGGGAWLRGFKAVLVGGGFVSQSLLAEARAKHIPVVPAYGMTEALGTVALDRSGGFGSRGEILPHWSVRLVDGEIELTGEALFHGYVPDRGREAPWHATGDLGQLDEAGRLVVLGRKDRLIITGGEKVNPALVEEALRASGLCRDAAVLGLDDQEWGQRVVAVLEGSSVETERVSGLLRTALPAYALPKAFRFVEKLPRTEMGKLDAVGLAGLFQ